MSNENMNIKWELRFTSRTNNSSSDRIGIDICIASRVRIDQRGVYYRYEW